MNDYDDIIRLPHHVSPTRPQMPRQDRAAQFSPFAALTGYEAATREAARLTEERIILDETAQDELDRKLQLLAATASARPEICCTCFQPDGKKDGGAYVAVCGAVKSVDSEKKQLVLDNVRIPFADIYALEGEIFAVLDGLTTSVIDFPLTP